jgi:hypothetical protein
MRRPLRARHGENYSIDRLGGPTSIGQATPRTSVYPGRVLNGISPFIPLDSPYPGPRLRRRSLWDSRKRLPTVSCQSCARLSTRCQRQSAGVPACATVENGDGLRGAPSTRTAVCEERPARSFFAFPAPGLSSATGKSLSLIDDRAVRRSIRDILPTQPLPPRWTW